MDPFLLEYGGRTIRLRDLSYSDSAKWIVDSVGGAVAVVGVVHWLCAMSVLCPLYASGTYDVWTSCGWQYRIQSTSTGTPVFVVDDDSSRS